DRIALLGETAVRLPVLQEDPTKALACGLEEHGAWRFIGHLAGSRASVFAMIAEGAQQREHHVVGRWVFRVVFEDRALEVLHKIGLAVRLRLLLEEVGDGVTLLGEASVLLPVFEESPTHGLARFRESLF